MDLPLCSSRACLHTAFIAISVHTTFAFISLEFRLANVRVPKLVGWARGYYCPGRSGVREGPVG